MKKSFLSKIEDKKAIIGVIGLGYVGLPLNLCFVEKGFRTIGFDLDILSFLVHGKTPIHNT